MTGTRWSRGMASRAGNRWAIGIGAVAVVATALVVLLRDRGTDGARTIPATPSSTPESGRLAAAPAALRPATTPIAPPAAPESAMADALPAPATAGEAPAPMDPETARRGLV